MKRTDPALSTLYSLTLSASPSVFVLDPLLSVSLNGSRDFLPVVLTLGSVRLRVSVPPPLLIKHHLKISVSFAPPLTHSHTRGEAEQRERGGPPLNLIEL